MMMKHPDIRILVALADGFEEIEALAPVDILRRAGYTVVLAGVGKLNITGAHGITVVCDTLMAEAGVDYTAMILPGGGEGLQESGRFLGSERKDAADRKHRFHNCRDLCRSCGCVGTCRTFGRPQGCLLPRS